MSSVGIPRKDFALSGVFGAHLFRPPGPSTHTSRLQQAFKAAHSYLRLSLELRARVDGPRPRKQPRVTGERHPVLRGFEGTDILPFSGLLDPMTIDLRAQD